LATIILTGLLVVAISTRFGRWGSRVVVPSTAVVTCIMTGIWMGSGQQLKGEQLKKFIGLQGAVEQDSLVGLV